MGLILAKCLVFLGLGPSVVFNSQAPFPCNRKGKHRCWGDYHDPGPIFCSRDQLCSLSVLSQISKSAFFLLFVFSVGPNGPFVWLCSRFLYSTASPSSTNFSEAIGSLHGKTENVSSFCNSSGAFDAVLRNDAVLRKTRPLAFEHDYRSTSAEAHLKMRFEYFSVVSRRACSTASA